MNEQMFVKETYIFPNGIMNFPNFQAYVKLFTDTVWQRSKEENAKGFEFFASLWRDEALNHTGVFEQKKHAVQETRSPEPAKAKRK